VSRLSSWMPLKPTDSEFGAIRLESCARAVHTPISHQFGWLVPRGRVHASLRPLSRQRAVRSSPPVGSGRWRTGGEGFRERNRAGSRAWRWALQDSNLGPSGHDRTVRRCLQIATLAGRGSRRSRFSTPLPSTARPPLRVGKTGTWSVGRAYPASIQRDATPRTPDSRD